VDGDSDIGRLNEAEAIICRISSAMQSPSRLGIGGTPGPNWASRSLLYALHLFVFFAPAANGVILAPFPTAFQSRLFPNTNKLVDLSTHFDFRIRTTNGHHNHPLPSLIPLVFYSEHEQR
jgi:hypothetical protein